MRTWRILAILAALSMLTLLIGAPSASAGQNRTYEVTIENLTDGQPFTPALVTTHKGNDELFTVGKPASFGLKEIAENGNLTPMLERLSNDSSFFEVVVQFGDDDPVEPRPPILPGEAETFTIEGGPPFNFISWASMLICTNDGFTGVDTVKLPNRVGQSVTLYTDGYDAGTEINTEEFADLVPPCGPLTGQDNMGLGTDMSNPNLFEDGVITHHEGILGVGDLDPEINDWDNPVGTITIERTG